MNKKALVTFSFLLYSIILCCQENVNVFDYNSYCIPTYTYGAEDGDVITNVQILGTSLNNNTGLYSPISYAYFTGQPNYTADLQRGNTFNLIVSGGQFGGNSIATWIDYNDDYFFDLSERIGVTVTPVAGNGNINFPFTIPIGTTIGNHKLRIRLVWYIPGATIDPCNNYNYGETEDYQINVCDVCSLHNNSFEQSTTVVFPNPVKESLDISFCDKDSEITIYDLSGKQVLNFATIQSLKEIEMSNFSKGIYFIKTKVNGVLKVLKFIKE